MFKEYGFGPTSSHHTDQDQEIHYGDGSLLGRIVGPIADPFVALLLDKQVRTYMLLSHMLTYCSHILLSYMLLSYTLLSYILLSHILLSYILLTYTLLSYILLSYILLSYMLLSYMLLS